MYMDKDKKRNTDLIICHDDNESLARIAEYCRYLRCNEDMNLAISDMHTTDGVKPRTKEMTKIVRLLQLSPIRYRKQFLVNEKDGYIIVPVAEISYISTEAGIVCLYLKSRKQYMVDRSLEEIERQLDPMMFFRATRQHIVSVSSILRISKWFNRKLKVILTEYPETEIIVSKEKVTRLKQWLDC